MWGNANPACRCRTTRHPERPYSLVDEQRAALAFIAIIAGVTGCIEGVMSMRAGSTAILADALVFVNHSISATLAS